MADVELDSLDCDCGCQPVTLMRSWLLQWILSTRNCQQQPRQSLDLTTQLTQSLHQHDQLSTLHLLHLFIMMMGGWAAAVPAAASLRVLPPPCPVTSSHWLLSYFTIIVGY